MSPRPLTTNNFTWRDFNNPLLIRRFAILIFYFLDLNKIHGISVDRHQLNSQNFKIAFRQT